MAKLTHKMIGDKVIFKIEIEPTDKARDWCVSVASRVNCGRGFDVPMVAKISEYFYKMDKFCGIDTTEEEREYLMPGQYMASLELGGIELPRDPRYQVFFELTGYALTDKDIKVANELLEKMSNIYQKYATAKKGPFDNIMLDPMFTVIVDLLETVSQRKMDVFKNYIDFEFNRIELYGPAITLCAYHWEIIRPGKYRKAPPPIL